MDEASEAMMGDFSDDDDDGPIDLAEAGEAPFEVGDLVALDPRYYDEDDPALDVEGEVLDLRPSGSGWRVLVAWEDDEDTWMSSHRLIDAG